MTNGNFRQIINQLDMRWRRRVPVIHRGRRPLNVTGLPGNDMRSLVRILT